VDKATDGVPGPRGNSERPGPLTQALLVAVRLYQLGLSPVLGRNCRFTPSCSEYAAGALARYGPLKGCWLAAKRLLRCHPFSAGGYDPVP